MARELREFEERRRVGFGYSLRGEEIKKASNLRSVMQQLPSLIVGPRVVRTPIVVRGDIVLPASGDVHDAEAPGTFNVYMRRDAIGSAYCLANLYVDGIKSYWEQLGGYKPEDIAGVEVYPRQSLVPIRFQDISSGCGVVLVWTKSLR